MRTLLPALTLLLLFCASSAKAQDQDASPVYNVEDITGLHQTDIDTALARPVEKRCGWLQNPTPNNLYLNDRDGQWTVSEQGSYSAKGDIPEPLAGQDGPKYFINTNGENYGNRCVCLNVKTYTDKENVDQKFIVEISGSKYLPLYKCKGDKSLK